MRYFATASFAEKEPDHDVAGVDFRRRDLAAEWQTCAGLEDAARRRHGPGVDFLSGSIAHGKAQARHLDRLAGFAHDGAFHDHDREAVLDFLRNLDAFELETAQVDRQADGREQRGGLRHVTHHFAARADQRHVNSDQHENERRPARRAARLLAARLHPPAAGVETFDVFGIAFGLRRLGGRGRRRFVFERRHQRRRIGDQGRLGLRRLGVDGYRRELRLRVLRRRLALGRNERFGIPGAKLAGGLRGRGGWGRRFAAGRGRRLRLGLRKRVFRIGGDFGRGLRPAGEPGGLAAGATHGTPGWADGGLIEHVGGGAVGTDDKHDFGADLLPEPSSRPLTDWKPCPARWSGGYAAFRGPIVLAAL